MSEVLFPYMLVRRNPNFYSISVNEIFVKYFSTKDAYYPKTLWCVFQTKGVWSRLVRKELVGQVGQKKKILYPRFLPFSKPGKL